ncbi:hypothetical protein ACWGCW_10780 [Streptomyces sp. NPDC054933]
MAKTAFLACAGTALAAIAAPSSASASAIARPQSPNRVVVDCFYKPQVRPANFLIACADGNNYLTALRWSQWGRNSATATGRDVVNDCKPYCAAGKFHSYPATVRLDRVRQWNGQSRHWQYGRLTVTYRGARPADTPKTMTYPLWS